MLAATQNVRPSHLLDKDLWRKLGLEAAAEIEEGDGLVGASRLVRDVRPSTVPMVPSAYSLRTALLPESAK